MMSPRKEESLLEITSVAEPMQDEISDSDSTTALTPMDKCDDASTATDTSSTTTTTTTTITTATKATRRTPATALKRTCEPCTQAKVKCDGQSPCTRCTRRQEVDKCVFRAQKKRGRRVQVLNHHNHHHPQHSQQPERSSTPTSAAASDTGASVVTTADSATSAPAVSGFVPRSDGNRPVVGLGMNNFSQQYQSSIGGGGAGLSDQLIAAFLANTGNNNNNNSNLNDGQTTNNWQPNQSSTTIARPFGRQDKQSLTTPHGQDTPLSLMRPTGSSSSFSLGGTALTSPRNNNNNSTRPRFPPRHVGSLGMQGASLGMQSTAEAIANLNNLSMNNDNSNNNMGNINGSSGIPNHEPFRPANINEQLALQRGQAQAMRHAHTFGTEQRVQLLAAKLSTRALERPNRVSIRTFLLSLKDMLEPSAMANNSEVLSAQVANLRRYLVSCRSQTALHALDAWTVCMRFEAPSHSSPPSSPRQSLSTSTSSSSLCAMLGIANSTPSTPCSTSVGMFNSAAATAAAMRHRFHPSASTSPLISSPRGRGEGEGSLDPCSVAANCFARVFGNPDGCHGINEPAVLTFREVLSKSPSSGERFAMSCNTALVRLVGQPAMTKLRGSKMGLLPWGGDLLAHLLMDEEDVLLIHKSIAEKLACISVNALPCRREIVLSQLCNFRTVNGQKSASSAQSSSASPVYRQHQTPTEAVLNRTKRDRESTTASMTPSGPGTSTLTRCVLRVIVIDELRNIDDGPSTVTVHFSITPQAASFASIASGGSPPKRLKSAGSEFNGSSHIDGMLNNSRSGGSAGHEQSDLFNSLPLFARVHLSSSELHAPKWCSAPTVADHETESDYVWIRNLLAFVTPNNGSILPQGRAQKETNRNVNNNNMDNNNSTNNNRMCLPLSLSSTSLSASVPITASLSCASLSALLPNSMSGASLSPGGGGMQSAMPTSISSSSISSLSSAFRGNVTPSSSNSSTSVASFFPDNNHNNMSNSHMNNNNNNFMNNNSNMGRVWPQRLMSQVASPLPSVPITSLNGAVHNGTSMMSLTPRGHQSLLGPSPITLPGNNNSNRTGGLDISSMNAVQAMTHLSRGMSTGSSSSFGM